MFCFHEWIINVYMVFILDSIVILNVYMVFILDSIVILSKIVVKKKQMHSRVFTSNYGIKFKEIFQPL